MTRRLVSLMFLTIGLSAVFGWVITRSESIARGEIKDVAEGNYRSPIAVAVSPDGKTAYVSDRSSGNVTILDIAGRKKLAEVALRGKPQGVTLSADGNSLYVAEHGAGTVAILDTDTKSVASRFEVGRWPTTMALAEKAKQLFVCNQDRHTVSV
ncbi:MAG: YncE family protein, partial [Pirellulaceae bacterium]|nr:YncE family protein [Pirellulaceae bacterium]